MKCPYTKICPLYKKGTITCEKYGGINNEGSWYCGKAREFAEQGK